MKKLELNLISGRHDLPAEHSIFHGPIAPQTLTNMDELEAIAITSLQMIAWTTKIETWCTVDDEHVFDFPHNIDVTIYVTGLSVALIAALNVLKEYDAKVTLAHYDRDNNKYFFQNVK